MSANTAPASAVVVDAYTTGNHLAPAFRRHGVRVVHVQSTPALMTTMMQPDLTQYEANIVLDDAGTHLDLLRAHRPLCVVAGQEPGVIPADTLADQLGVPGNRPELSVARRDKYEMTEALRRAGVRCADQFTSADPDQITAWAAERGGRVVVKPRTSAATDHVVVCDTPGQVRQAAAEVLAARDIFGAANTEALVQAYLEGPEFKVDTVSYAGERYTCGVWQYHKRLVDGRNIYDRDEIREPEDAATLEITGYVDEVLRALGIAYGPSHTEVIVTADGPVLVEVGARTAGGLVPPFHDACLGGNQADVTALAFTDPERFRARYAGRAYRKLRHASQVYGATTLSGTVAAVDTATVERIEALGSVYRFTPKKRPGDTLRPTVDLYSTTFVAHLAAGSAEELRRDYEVLQSLKDALYVLEEA
ncbi:ATP-grasp domain-containing protein [Streptomyces nitrosporeus]|uniref:ATP-grasp domain-containing protein n=1 Tax=Streptomyces nitrosporeus TaxID=28894 RepID=UPI003316AEA3